MSETRRNPKVATQDDLEEYRAHLEQAQQGKNTGEQSDVAEPTEPEAGTASDAVDAESQPTNASEVVAPLGYDEAIARRKEIRTYLDPIFAARAALIEQGDVKQGTFRREWFNAAKPLLDKAGYPVDSTLQHAEFFSIVRELQAEDRALKEQTASERAARKARAPRERTAPIKTTKPDRRQAKPLTSKQKRVTQERLDNIESRTRVWEIDSDEADIIARERFRRAVSRAPGAAVVPQAEAPRTYLETIDTVRDLVTVDGVNGVHIPKGSGRLSGRYMSDYQMNSVVSHADQIRNGLSERAEETAFLERAKAFIPALGAIDSALEAVDMNDDDKVQAVIRRALVASGIYGTDTARQIGNLSNEELMRLIDFARSADSQPARAEAQRGNAHPTALPPEAYGPDAGTASAHPTALPPEAYGPDASEPTASAHPTALPPEAYGPDTDDLDIFGTAHPTALPPEAYGVETDHDRELDTTIADARNRYAQLTAKDRISYFGRFLQGDSGLTKLLRRIPGVARIADSINKHQSRDKDAAQAEYEALVDGISGEITADTVEQQLAHRKAWMINESLALEQAIADYTKESSKDAGAFTNWWMSQEGKRFGKAKKAAVIAVGSAATAALATVFLPSVMFGLATGSLVGGITGGVVAHRVTKRRNNADVKVGRNAIMSRADYEAAYSMNQHYDAITQASEEVSAADITTRVEAKSDIEMLRNRKRVGTAKGIGAAAGGLTGLGLGRLHEVWDSHSQAAADAQSALEKADAAREAAEAKAKALQEQLAQQANGGAESGAGDFGGSATDTSGATEALRGNSFTVENGSGFVKEWGQWANLNGHKIDSSTASELHKAVLEKFGPDGVIDLKSLPTNAETYIQNGDLRIGAPGAAQWQPGVADFARDWLKSQGKW